MIESTNPIDSCPGKSWQYASMQSVYKHPRRSQCRGNLTIDTHVLIQHHNVRSQLCARGGLSLRIQLYRLW